MPRSLQPRGSAPRATMKHTTLPRDVVDEVRRSTRPPAQQDTLARLGRAIELLEREDPKAAVVEAEKAKRLSSRSASVREVLGLAYYGQGRWREALAELKAYKRITGRNDQNHLIADSLRGIGRPMDAVPLADEAIRDRAVSNEVKAEVVVVAAAALADEGRFAEALAFLGRARTKDDVAEPYTLRLWYVKADILERAGRKRDAANELRKIVRHDATAFDAAERLATLA
jgi:tetratricopeptide (TPR) repeat protein